jgi:hypothetical protein
MSQPNSLVQAVFKVQQIVDRYQELIETGSLAESNIETLKALDVDHIAVLDMHLQMIQRVLHDQTVFSDWLAENSALRGVYTHAIDQLKAIEAHVIKMKEYWYER